QDRPKRRVWPSGLALANSLTPIVPPPPGRFSTMTGFPRRLDKSFATRRAATSTGDPEGSEQMTLISLLGYVCAVAASPAIRDTPMAAAAGNIVARRVRKAHFQRCIPVIGPSISNGDVILYPPGYNL